MDATVIEQPSQAPEAPAADSAATPPDPFALDENALVSLTPEQRAGLEPILDTWKKKANEEISKRETDYTTRYKPYQEKATALDKLTQYQPFVQWWQQQQQSASHGATANQQQQINNTNPYDVATPQQWQEAVLEMSNGDSAKFNQLQQKSIMAMAQPFVQQITQDQKQLRTELDLKDLFTRHKDALELDKIGIDDKTKEGVSLLEIGLDWAEKNGKSYEEGYSMAKRWYDSMSVSAQQKAMGMVQDKKDAVLSNPSNAKGSGNVTEVNDFNDLITQELRAQIAGNKDARFVIKQSQ